MVNGTNRTKDIASLFFHRLNAGLGMFFMLSTRLFIVSARRDNYSQVSALQVNAHVHCGLQQHSSTADIPGEAS